MSVHPVTPAIKRAHFGVIGLGVMGQNLALNLADHGRDVAVWNLEPDWVDRFIQQNGQQRFVGTRTLEDLVRALEPPRQILMMIKAGAPVDEMLAQLRPYLSPGDIVIDGGNSFFQDTQRREAEMRGRGVYFVGMGVSGGEEGARHGPSLMPGGAREAYQQLSPALEAIAAKTDSGPCVTYVGPDGAGHFVKMVHNGIEYGDMQLIAEAYDILRKGLSLSAAELAGIFAKWNRGPLESYLMEITAQIFTVADPEAGRPLVDLVLDKAGQKGTGKWTAQVALDLGVPIPTIEAALDARLLSTMKDERVAASAALAHGQRRYEGDGKELTAAVHDALLASKVCCYAQGMSLIRAGSNQYRWSISLREMARIWKGGCIIRARLLDAIMRGSIAGRIFLICCSMRNSARRSGKRSAVGVGQWRRRCDLRSRRRRFPRRWRITMPIVRRCCRRTSSRRSGISSERTPTSAPIGQMPASRTPIGTS